MTIHINIPLHHHKINVAAAKAAIALALEQSAKANATMARRIAYDIKHMRLDNDADTRGILQAMHDCENALDYLRAQLRNATDLHDYILGAEMIAKMGVQGAGLDPGKGMFLVSDTDLAAHKLRFAEYLEALKNNRPSQTN